MYNTRHSINYGVTPNPIPENFEKLICKNLIRSDEGFEPGDKFEVYKAPNGMWMEHNLRANTHYCANKLIIQNSFLTEVLEVIGAPETKKMDGEPMREDTQFYYVIVTSSCTGKEALAVSVDYALDLMDAFAGHINENEDVVKVYPMPNFSQARKVADGINQLQDKREQYMEEVVMEVGRRLETGAEPEPKEVYQAVKLDRENPEYDNYHISRMDKEKQDKIEKMTDDMYVRLQEYHDFMRLMVGDGAYTKNIEKVQREFGQIRADLFNPIAGLM